MRHLGSAGLARQVASRDGDASPAACVRLLPTRTALADDGRTTDDERNDAAAAATMPRNSANVTPRLWNTDPDTAEGARALSFD